MGIQLKNVSYRYQVGTPFESQAITNVSLEIKKGSYTAFIGHTGSGKSTIMQLLNGLNLPTEGIVSVDDVTITASSKQKVTKDLRRKVGLVFQFPESQIFEETVLKDVAFGPQNFGVSKDEAEKQAKEKLALVGIEESLYDRNPFNLSGGQMRRVAIAGILAMNPDYLVLDEPTAGLDPAGRKELMQLFSRLHRQGITIILVTHVMEDVANYADQVYMMQEGKLCRSGSPKQLFQSISFMEKHQLGVPKVTQLAADLEKKGWVFEQLPITIEELVEVIKYG